MNRTQPDNPPLGPLQGIVLLQRKLAVWRGKRRASPLWTLLVAAILAIVSLPVITVVVLATHSSQNTWAHLSATVLPAALRDTTILLFGVGCIVLVTGTMAAWIVTMYRFPWRGLVDRLLVLPLAIPTYIVAYAYVDLLDFAGPVQTLLRQVTGWRSARDYWFPDVRSMPGAILILSSVLYPYVYLAARASFVQQSVCALEVARTLGRTPFGAFVSVALPMARPALAAGAALALMETLNDLGAVQHLGVQTLSSAIHATWLQRSSLAGASQIAIVTLLLIAVLLTGERFARSGGSFHNTTGRVRSIPFADLTGWRAVVALAFCALPAFAGFGVPVLMLMANAWHHGSDALAGGFWRAAANSFVLASLATVITVALGLIVAYARRVAANGFTRPAVRLAGLGYALPGTVLALGLVIPLAAFDNWIDASFRAWLGLSTGLLLSGTLAALVLAYTIRFLAVSLGTVEAGLERISPNLDAAARTLGETSLSALWHIHLPLLLPVLGTAALLVFVDVMKELPATVLMRPFNFETLATHVYALASLEQPEAASVGALAIVAVGLVPALLLHRAVARGRPGH